MPCLWHYAMGERNVDAFILAFLCSSTRGIFFLSTGFRGLFYL